MEFYEIQALAIMIPTTSIQVVNLDDYWWGSYCLSQNAYKWEKTLAPLSYVNQVLPTLNHKDLEFQKKGNSLDCFKEISSTNEKVSSPEGNLEETSNEGHAILEGYKYKIIRWGSNMNKIDYKWMYPGCDKVFKKTWNFLDHARMHENIKPFRCKFWSKTFTQKGNMLKHSRQHSVPNVADRKTHKCLLCGSAFTEKYNLKVKHIV